MDAIILCGGRATRMGALCATTPKVLLPVGGRPLLEITIERLAGAGCTRAVLAVGHLAEVVEQWAATRRRSARARRANPPRQVGVSREDQPQGTGGAVREVAPSVARWPCLVLNGDVLADVAVAALWRAHRRSGAAATIATVRVPDASEYGLLDIGPDGWVLRFREKQPRAGAGFINVGWYVLERQAVDMVPSSGFSMLERDVFPRLAESRRLFSYVHEGYWHDIGTPQRYQAAQRELAR